MFDRDFFADLFDERKDFPEIATCGHDHRVIDGHLTCILCGEVNLDKPIFSELLDRPNIKQYFIYHRKSYFREKLRLLVGIKVSMSTSYQSVINSLKRKNFETILELKKIMQREGYHKYYKYIYNIYYEIKGQKLINLNSNQIDSLTNKFLKIEHAFKVSFPNKSNLLSYNIIIHLLLKKYGFNCYRHIILPKNYRKLVKNITELLKNTEIY